MPYAVRLRDVYKMDYTWGFDRRYSECMKKNDRSTDAFWLCLMGRQETRWMRDESLFLIACGWILTPFLSVLTVLSWLTFLWIIGRYPNWVFRMIPS